MKGEDLASERSPLRDEGLSKNPIRDRMALDEIPVSRDELHDMVARARDVFHSYIAHTVHRAYKRPPIYLVDGWVTHALGLFTRAKGAVTIDPRRPGAQGGSHTLENGPPGAFAGIYALYRSLNQLRREFHGLSVIKMSDTEARIVEGCAALLARKASFPDDTSVPRELFDLLDAVKADAHALRSLLEQNVQLHGRVNDEFFARLSGSVDALGKAVSIFAREPAPQLHGMSFDPSRFGGLLLEDIPDLDIQAPAILLAPSRIAGWSEGAPMDSAAKIDGSLWFGARSPDHLAFAIGISNVLQHELTHAMLRLPNDAPDDEYAQSQDWQYARDRGFEEGIANYVATLTTASSLLKSQREIRGTPPLNMNSATNRKIFDAQRPLLYWTFAHYHEAETREFLEAWDSSSRDFRAFSGMLAMFATQHGNTDWDQSRQALQQLHVATTGLGGRR